MIHEGWITSIPIAHRGFHNSEFPENSIGAFINAKKHGFSIELDVQLSADDTIVVFHDTDTFRMTQENGKIKELSLSQIKKRKLQNSDFEIPTLKEVFDIVDAQTPILIEIKNDENPGKLEMLLCSEINKYQGTCAVQSFNPLSLQFVKRKCPHILRGQLSQSFKDEKMNIFKKFTLKHFMLNNLSEPHFISYRIDDLPNRKVCSFRKKGMPIIGWTIASKKERYGAKIYCDNIIFENLSIENVFSFYEQNSSI
jgi:glycerophosphoryl diester phosphodiesterase